MSIEKHNSKAKEFFLIIKSGVVGTLVLNGITTILFLFGFAYRNEFISSLYQRIFAQCSFEGLFIATSGIGFILGILARRRISLRNEIILIAAFSFPLIIGVWLIDSFASHASTPHSIKLADCTNEITSIHLKVPKGHAYQLELITPETHAAPNGTIASTYKFSGHIHISQGLSLIADFPIGSDNAWLTGTGFVLTGVGTQNTNVPPLGKFVEAGKSYQIEITLNPPPSSTSSIWLYWLQSRMDMER